MESEKSKNALSGWSNFFIPLQFKTVMGSILLKFIFFTENNCDL